MNLSGSVKVQGAVERVWQVLNNSEVLRQCTPGCRQLTAAGEGTYDVVMQVAVGAVKGSYAGKIQIADAVPNSEMRLIISGSGNTGFLQAEGVIRLHPLGESTTIEYSGTAHIGGLIAGVGQRIVEGVARNMVGQFFKCLGGAVSAASGAAPGGGV